MAIVCSPASPTTRADPLIKAGAAKLINAGGSTAVVVVVSPSASVTGTENATVWSILNIRSGIGVGLKTGAVFVQTMKSKVVVFVAPRLSVPVRVIVVVPAVVGDPEKVQVAVL